MESEESSFICLYLSRLNHYYITMAAIRLLRFCSFLRLSGKTSDDSYFVFEHSLKFLGVSLFFRLSSATRLGSSDSKSDSVMPPMMLSLLFF